MKIAIANWTDGLVGGVESYLGALLPALADAGYELALWHEVSLLGSASPIDPAGLARHFCVQELGLSEALGELRTWHPDVIFTHGLLSPSREERLFPIAPIVAYPHSYYGTCISGHKTFSFPRANPCTRTFGPGCLLRYFPCRCGGRSPWTMATAYRRQTRRLALLRRARGLVVGSTHMRREYLRHGFDPDRVWVLPTLAEDLLHAKPHAERDQPTVEAPWRLAFLGRMDRLKGGGVLLEALPSVWAALRHPLSLSWIGDGPARAGWERAACRVTQAYPAITSHFAGWLDAPARDAALADVDLLVMPSLWPEPFGRAGPDAGRLGVPAAAFDVGGIGDWLHEGVNGHLAPGTPPTAAGLAAAIGRCLADRDHLAALRRGARDVAAHYTREAHVSLLVELLEAAACASS